MGKWVGGNGVAIGPDPSLTPTPAPTPAAHNVVLALPSCPCRLFSRACGDPNPKPQPPNPQGVVKGLLDQKLLPRVLSGSSVGSIGARACGGAVAVYCYVARDPHHASPGPLRPPAARGRAPSCARLLRHAMAASLILFSAVRRSRPCTSSRSNVFHRRSGRLLARRFPAAPLPQAGS